MGTACDATATFGLWAVTAVKHPTTGRASV